jgi:hypothetical protein
VTSIQACPEWFSEATGCAQMVCKNFFKQVSRYVMPTRPIVPSDVWINGKHEGVELSPYICECGLWLHNESWGGPHIKITIPPSKLASILRGATNEEAAVELNLPELGSIDRFSGYAAADLGRHTRNIDALNLTVHREQNSTVFYFQGEAGRTDPGTVGHPCYHSEYLGSYKFSIRFTIDDFSLSEHLGDRETIEAMSSFISEHSDELSC